MCNNNSVLRKVAYLYEGSNRPPVIANDGYIQEIAREAFECLHGGDKEPCSLCRKPFIPVEDSSEIERLAEKLKLRAKASSGRLSRKPIRTHSYLELAKYYLRYRCPACR